MADRPYISAGSRLGFAGEVTFGTKVTPDSFFGLTNQDIELPDVELDVRQFRSFGFGRRWAAQVPGRRTYKGGLPITLTNAEMLYYAFGSETFVADGGGGYNIHVLDPTETAVMPSFTWGAGLVGQEDTNDFLRNWVGTVISGAAYTAGESGELTVDFDTFSIDVEDEQTDSPTLFSQPSGAGEIPYMFYDRNANIRVAGVYDFSSVYTAAGAYVDRYTGARAWSRIKSFNFSVNHNLKEQYYYRSTSAQNPAEFITSNPDFDLTLQLVPAGKLAADDDAVYDLLVGETAFDVLIPFRRTDTDRLDFACDNCIVKSAKHGLSTEGNEVMVEVILAPETIRAIAYNTAGTYVPV